MKKRESHVHSFLYSDWDQNIAAKWHCPFGGRVVRISVLVVTRSYCSEIFDHSSLFPDNLMVNHIQIIIPFITIVMQPRHYPPRNKIKTLCTIDTTDIDFQQGRGQSSKKPNQAKASRQHPTQSPSIGRGRPVRHPLTPSNIHYQRYFKTQKLVSKSPSNNSRSKARSGDRGRQRLKTDYSGCRKSAMKSLLGRKSVPSKNRCGSIAEESYVMDTYQVMEELPSHPKQKMYLVRKVDRLYLMKKTKCAEMKKQYQAEAAMKAKLGPIKWRNLRRVVRVYSERSWSYVIYEYHGQCLSWSNSSHCQVIERILKHEGAVLKHVIRELAKAIAELSGRGFVHGRLRVENICLKIQELKTAIKIQGNVRLCNLGSAFSIKDKIKLFTLPSDIYTPPQLINLKLFECGHKFDRQLIEHINHYDEPWLVDVWALGVLVLELVAGETISIEKADSPAHHSSDTSMEKAEDIRNEWQHGKQITLSDILEAQKSILLQTQPQINKLGFDPKLQRLLVRMLSVQPPGRPSPKEILREL